MAYRTLLASPRQLRERLLRLLERELASVGPDLALTTHVPEESANQLAQLKENIVSLNGKGIHIEEYPWSDFSPETGRDNEGYLLRAMPGHIDMLATKIIEDETELGYHHELA